MSTKKWYFQSAQPWQLFADSFRRELGAWKGNLAHRLMGCGVVFETASDTGGAFQALDDALRVKLDVIAQMTQVNGTPIPSSVRLTLTDLGGATGGHIEFFHGAGAAGKDLGELTQQSILAVDSQAKFKPV